MSQYWYFAATLPALQFGERAPMSGERFLQLCGEQLDPRDCAAVEAATLSSAGDEGEPPALPFLAAYRAWERGVGNELARARARRMGRSADPWIRPSAEDDRAPASARAALDAANPLEGELALERERWAFIDGLRGLAAFSLDSLLAYRLQLQILERLERFSAEAGEAEYRDIYAAILGGANPIEQTGDDR